MSGMGGNTHERNAEEPFRNDFRNLQRVKLLPFLLRQNTLHCPAQRSRLVATQDSGSYFTGQVEKIPIHALDVSSQRRAIKTLDDSPPRQEGFTFDRQVRRQTCVFPDQNGSLLAWVERKSTRLNSSHLVISYAVFCLKKKKKKKIKRNTKKKTII